MNLLTAGMDMMIFAVLLILLIFMILLWRRQKHGSDQANREISRLEEMIISSLEQERDESARCLFRMSHDIMNNINGAMQNMMSGQQGQSNDLHQGFQQLDGRISRMETQMDRFRDETQRALDSQRRENQSQLDQMRRTVDERLQESLDKRLNESFSNVSQHLQRLNMMLGEMRTLSGDVGDLKKVLSGVKTRGIWGEIQLGALLEDMLAPGQYAANVEIVSGSKQRVEYAILLPGHDGQGIWLPVDSKFPVDRYAAVVQAEESGQAEMVKKARNDLAAAIRQQAKEITKYIHLPQSTDFAVMFLPTESLYAEVARIPALIEEVQRTHRVLISGPSTFASLLTSLQIGFKTMAIEQKSGEVWKLLGKVKTEIGSFADNIGRVQQNIIKASDELDKVNRVTRKIQTSLKQVEQADTGLLIQGEE